MSTLWPLSMLSLLLGAIVVGTNLYLWNLSRVMIGLVMLGMGIFFYQAEAKARRQTNESPQQKLTDYTNDQ